MVKKKPEESSVKLEEFYAWVAPFEQDRSPEGQFQAKRVGQARASLYVDLPFFGYLLGQFVLIPVKDKRISSFSIDYKNLYFNTSIIEKLEIKGIKGVLLHLITHQIMKHFERGKGRQSKIWSVSAEVSTDLMVRETIQTNQMDISSISPTAHLKNFIGRPTEYIFSQLEAEVNEIISAGVSDRSDDTDQKSHFDKEKRRKIFNEALQDVMDEHQLVPGCNFHETMEALSKAMSKEMRELMQDRFSGMLRTAYNENKRRGNLPAEMKTLITELVAPKIPWMVILQNYIQRTLMTDWKWHPPSKKTLTASYQFPSIEQEFLEIAIAVDTSGSISKHELRMFTSEAFSIFTNFSRTRLTLIDCDAKIHKISVYEDGESITGEDMPWEGRPFTGGGGTSFVPVFEYYTKHDLPHTLVYFTDGYGVYPDESLVNFPVIWAITSDLTPPFGEIIRISL